MPAILTVIKLLPIIKQANKNVPTRTILRMPIRSMSLPTNGAANAATTLCKVNASEIAERLVWNSLVSALRKTGKENTRIGGPPIPSPSAAAKTIHQP